MCTGFLIRDLVHNELSCTVGRKNLRLMFSRRKCGTRQQVNTGKAFSANYTIFKKDLFAQGRINLGHQLLKSVLTGSLLDMGINALIAKINFGYVLLYILTTESSRISNSEIFPI